MTDQTQQDPTNQAGASQNPATQQTSSQDPAQQPKSEDTTPANYQLGKYLPEVLKVKIPAHTLTFNEQQFLRLLAGSISLMRDEKKKIIESIPKLKQLQVDELIRIFTEEREKFAELSEKHVPQLDKLAKQHYQDWMDIEAEFEAESKKADAANQAYEIRKQLGL